MVNILESIRSAGRRENLLLCIRSGIGGIFSAHETLTERYITDQLPVGKAVAGVCQVGMQCNPFRLFDLVGVQYVDTLGQGRHSADEVNIRFAKLIRVLGGERHNGFAL